MEEVLSKYFSGEASDEEIKSVHEWRSATENNSKEFLEFKKIWLASQPIEEGNPAMLNSILADEESAPKIIPIWNQKIFRIAAAIIVALGLVFALYPKKADNHYGQVVATVTPFELPDGTIATLQRGASITIGDFKDKREVFLTGKAFFEVERNENKPFIVNTTNVLVEVLGTSFVVDAREERNAVEVMVSSGSVAMAQNPEVFGRRAMKINLEKGEMGIIQVGERGIKKRKITDDNFLSWKTRVITFKSTSLNEVSKTMNEVYGVTFDYENQMLKNCVLTAKFNEKTVDEVVDIIAETFNFTYVKTADKILFTGNSCK
ncbi:FecR family protein [Marinoscillum sp. 108]|uniref:FecR family protein n=1 Tax=Marinoscillum sp. 108 TaxID=2653151 RepID=UPI0012EF6D22|nr:FecR domain-containing protein [Marinoscillum sp. 108]VXD12053.1 FecR family protein [Marinoscillum sp. 108]